MSKAILVFGATGKQGGSVVRELLAHPKFSPTIYTILAATRNTESAGAKRLAGLSPAIKLVTGDLSDPTGTFKGLPVKPWAVYGVTMPGKAETAQGNAIANLAYEAGASHIVFSSVDRGEAEERNSPTYVPHFITKHDIEANIRGLAEKSGGKFTYTIIRPPFFLDNLEPGFMGKVIATVWRDNVKDPVTVIDTIDIGSFAASALLEPESKLNRNGELNISGDRLTFQELDQKFREKTGHGVPTTYSFVASLLLWMVHDVNMMVKFWKTIGFTDTVAESNQLHKMKTVEQWLDKSKHMQKSN